MIDQVHLLHEKEEWNQEITNEFGAITELPDMFGAIVSESVQVLSCSYCYLKFLFCHFLMAAHLKYFMKDGYLDTGLVWYVFMCSLLAGNRPFKYRTISIVPDKFYKTGPEFLWYH